MHISSPRYANLLFFALLYLVPACSIASHIVGGRFVYQYLGDTLISEKQNQKYTVTLFLYQDCITGVPDAIQQDNPAFFTIYEQGMNTPFKVDSGVFYNPSPGSGGAIAIPPENVSSPCGYVTDADLPPQCLLRKAFSKTYYLPYNSTGYTVVYQRCCRNSSILNIVAPGNMGSTFYCDIPTAGKGNNTSAVFSKYPPQIICNNTSLLFDHSATDADGDSLTYEFYSPFTGTNNADIKPYIASPPPFDAVNYTPSYSYDAPMGAHQHVTIDATTGMISVIPNKIGRYLIGISCKEWRGGTLINETRSEFQWTVITCKSFVNNNNPRAGENKTILVGESIHFDASGADRYLWTPGDFLNNPYIPDPVGVFTQKGTFRYVLYGASEPDCTGSDTVTITVMEHSDFGVPNAFTPNGDGVNDLLTPMASGNATFKQFRVYNRMGNLIFTSTNAGSGWDGNYNGNSQCIGVYFWSVDFTDNEGIERIKSGNTTLLR
jgi:gliding motility-associated-like protein